MVKGLFSFIIFCFNHMYQKKTVFYSLLISVFLFLNGASSAFGAEFIWNGRSVNDRVEDLIDFLLRIAGGLALFMLIVSGITYAFSSGSPEIGTKAKKIFISALMGLILVILSYSFLAFMDQLLTN